MKKNKTKSCVGFSKLFHLNMCEKYACKYRHLGIELQLYVDPRVCIYIHGDTHAFTCIMLTMVTAEY